MVAVGVAVKMVSMESTCCNRRCPGRGGGSGDGFMVVAVGVRVGLVAVMLSKLWYFGLAGGGGCGDGGRAGEDGIGGHLSYSVLSRTCRR